MLRADYIPQAEEFAFKLGYEFTRHNSIGYIAVFEDGKKKRLGRKIERYYQEQICVGCDLDELIETFGNLYK